MKKIISLLSSLIAAAKNVLAFQLSAGPDPGQKLLQLKKDVSANLVNNILPFWSTRMPDDVNGGFYGRIDANNAARPSAEKGGILNARILWTYSAAYRVTKNPEYLRLATRARDYIIAHFIDREFGGAFRSLNANGEPRDERKQTYTQAFFICGLAEYARAAGDNESLQEAKNIFELLEKYVLDEEANGYYEVFTREWQRSRDMLIGEKSAVDEKTMNTSLHVMEAFANLYRAWPETRMAERLSNMVVLFLDRIIDTKSGHLVCFFDRNWNPTSRIDSYGHDIEASWLLYEAACLLNDRELLERVKAASITLADAAVQGLQPDGSMVTERDRATGRMSTTISWWEQAESVVGYTHAYQRTGDEAYLNTAIHSWGYISRYLVDRKNGAWFSSVTPEGVRRGDKAGFWICPYHNGRMCLEIMERVPSLARHLSGSSRDVI